MTTVYRVHSSFLTIQGEGYHAGRPAVFVRFSGCNIWNGLEKDRDRDALAHSPCARICDTKFFGIDDTNGGGNFNHSQLIERISNLWANRGNEPLVVFTGGEPSLQLDEALCRVLRWKGFQTAVETNGTRMLDARPDWVTLSPKPPMEIVRQAYDEVKVLYPLFDPLPYEKWALSRYVSPVDYTAQRGEDGSKADWSDIRLKNTMAYEACVDFVMKHPIWKVSIQMHKVLGIQ